MPILLEEPTNEIRLRSPTGGPVIEPPKSDDSVLGAAMRLESMPYNVARSIFKNRYPDEPDYNPFADESVKDTRYGSEYGDRFTYVRSKRETQDIITQIEQEEKDRARLESAGLPGLGAQVLMGVVDPTILLPGGAIYRSAKTGVSLGRTMLSVGLAGGAQAALQEAGLQATQQTRTASEAWWSIGSATLLSAFLGTGVAAILSRGERIALESSFKNNRAALIASVSDRSAGAAQTDTRTMELSSIVPDWLSGGYAKFRKQIERIPVVGKGAGKIMGVPEWLGTRTNPVMRIMTGGSVEARRILGDLAEIPLQVEDNLRGVPTSAFGLPLEREIRNAIRQAEYQLTQEAEQAFKRLRFGGNDVKFAKFRAFAERRLGKSEGMTFDEFMEEVDAALRNADTHDIPEVAALAAKFRQVINAPFEKAKALGVLDEGQPLGAPSYAPRNYVREKMIAEKPEFTNRYIEERKKDQATKAGLKDQITTEWEALRKARVEGRKAESRLATIDARIDKLEARLSERGMEATAALKRAKRVEARRVEAEAALIDAKEFLDELRASADPQAVREQIARLESDIRKLEAQTSPVGRDEISDDLDKVEKRELRKILTGDMRRVARIVIGKAKPPKPPSFWKWLAAEGGVKDDGGDLRSMLGGKAFDTKGNKLFRTDGLQWDMLQEKLMGEFPELRALWTREGLAEDFSDDIRQAIADSVNGQEPYWFLDTKWNDADRMVAETAAALETSARDLGIKFQTVDDVARFVRGEPDDAMTEADYDAMIASIEGSGAATDFRVAAMDAGAQIAVRQGTLDVLADTLKKAKANVVKERMGAGKAGAREAEADIASNRSLGRLGVLDERSRIADRQRDFIGAMRSRAADDEAAALKRIEDLLLRWEGKSASGAKGAIARRGEAEAARGEKQAAGTYKGKGERLTSADAEIARAVRSIMRSNRDLTDAELLDEAEQTFNEIISTPDGRLPKDDPGYGRMVPQGLEGAGRGPLQARKLPMPDSALLPFLDRNPLRYTVRYLRSMLSDLGIYERFGDFDMKMALKRVADEADTAARNVDAAERTAIYADRDRVIGDLAAIRDRLKGTFGFSPNAVMRNIGHVSQVLGDYDVTTNMGGSGIAQFPDMAGAVMRYAFTGTKAFGPAFRSLVGHLTKTGDTFAKARSELKAMGIGTEAYLNSRAHDLADIGDVYQPGTKFARIMRTGAEATMFLSGSSLVTDWAKTVAGIAAGNHILTASRKIRAGTATKKMIASLAQANIDPDMAVRIADAFDNGGGRVEKGVYLPNTMDWTDIQARKQFEAAVGYEVDIAVVSPGEEKPLFLSQPGLQLIGKYKSFIAAANTRILLANLQRRDASTLAGLTAMVGLGMFSYAARSYVTGMPLSDRPQDWVKEGFDRSGVLGWFGEANAMAAQVTRGSGDIWRLVGADKPLSRYSSRSVLGSLLGPIGGKIEGAAQVTGAAATGEWSPSDVRRLRQLLPYQNLFYIRRLIDQVEGAAQETFGIEPRRANG